MSGPLLVLQAVVKGGGGGKERHGGEDEGRDVGRHVLKE